MILWSALLKHADAAALGAAHGDGLRAQLRHVLQEEGKLAKYKFCRRTFIGGFRGSLRNIPDTPVKQRCEIYPVTGKMTHSPPPDMCCPFRRENSNACGGDKVTQHWAGYRKMLAQS